MTGRLRGALSAGVLLAAACAPGRSTPPVRPVAVDSAAAPDTVAAADTAPVPAVAVPAPAPRDTAPARPPRAALALAFVGDINLGTATLPDGIPPDAGRGLLAAARPHLTGDLVIGNFEGVLADSGTSWKCGPPPDTASARGRHGARRCRGARRARKNCYAFRTPTALAPRLGEAGFTHLGLANNHANDYGLAARLATDSILRGLGLTPYGPLGSIAVDTVRRGDSVTVVGVLGFATYPYAYDLLDQERSAAVVDSMRRQVDFLVVTFHGGAEGRAAVRTPDGPEFLGREPRGHLRRWARRVIDAGADLVVGHGPHVLRGIEFYRGRPIAYSLGNFATYRGFNLSGPLGITAVLQLQFDPAGRFAAGRLVPMRQPPRRGPIYDGTGAALALVRRLSAEDFGEHAARIGPDGAVLPPAATLTGDAASRPPAGQVPTPSE